METRSTTLETLVAAAIGHDAETLGNNSGATYTNRFVFCGKYAFEAYCKDDKNIWITLCNKVTKTKSNMLIGHLLHIMHNPLLAPIYAQFLWADFESLLYSNNIEDVVKEDFAIALLNGREDDLVDRANSTIEQVFATTKEYEKLGDGSHYFMSKFGPVYLNQDCLEYYVDALPALPEDILVEVEEHVGFAKELSALSKLRGLTSRDIVESAKEARLKLLDMILDIVDPDCFNWALKADKAIKDARNARLESVKKLNANTAEAYAECLKCFEKDAESIIETYGTISLAEEIYDWQTAKGISFDFQTLALLFHELGAYEAEFADELLRDNEICEVIKIAYVAPSGYNN